MIKTEEKTNRELFEIISGLEMLLESNKEHMNTLSELAIILNSDIVREKNGLEGQGDRFCDFLSAVRWILNGVSEKSYEVIKNQIRPIIENK